MCNESSCTIAFVFNLYYLERPATSDFAETPKRPRFTREGSTVTMETPPHDGNVTTPASEAIVC